MANIFNMKIAKLITYIFSAVLIYSLYSCAVDRTYEYEAKVENDKWIEEIMKEHYLWYNNMPELKFNDYFALPVDFLQKIVFKGNGIEKKDIYSYVEVNDTSFTQIDNLTQEKSSYGFEFELITDPTGKTVHTSARVLFVLPNSPAYRAGLKRGDWIYEVDNARITNDNFGFLMQGGAKTFTLRDLTEVNDELEWLNERDITISAAEIVENNPFYVDTTYNIGGRKISYLVYNKFSTGPKDKSTDTQYLNEMKQIFTKFKSEAANDFILDLRYNPGGYLSCGEELASMLAPSNALGKTFVTLQYNDKSTPATETYKFNSDLSAYNLNLNKIYIITSSFTASTSEAVINSLKPYMGNDNVITIGESTEGENVALKPFTKDSLDFILWPVVAYVLNADNSGDYSNGITPTYPISERKYFGPLLPLGDTNELLLKNTISLITSGNIVSQSKNKRNNSKISKQPTSINLRNHIGSKVK